ncbi:MAG: ribosome-associated translation inhibitor RaiA [Alphaproteobacteria bacterium]|nr:ribosome-associated translation inhibitor RaiA [Alphaproteobacteria bacterium]
MEILIHGKNMDVGDALRGHTESTLRNHVVKYFSRAIDAHATFSRAAHGFRSDISVHPRRGMLVQGSAEAGDAYAAFDNALNRIDKQLRRYKRRLNDRHKGNDDEAVLRAQQYVLAPESEAELPDQPTPPVIVAEMPHDIATLSVSEAVMRMDLAHASVLMFRNKASGSFNVVYRRDDGNIGWIDPTAA